MGRGPDTHHRYRHKTKGDQQPPEFAHDSILEEHRSGVQLDPDCEMQQHVASLNALASALLWSTEARVVYDIARRERRSNMLIVVVRCTQTCSDDKMFHIFVAS